MSVAGRKCLREGMVRKRKLFNRSPILACVGAAGLALGSLAGEAAGLRSMAGSAHDFSQASWNISHNPCLPCHQEQDKSNPSVQSIVESSVANYSVYNSPTLNAGGQRPGGVSLICLSCHDGTLAVNEFIRGANGAEEGEYVDKGFQVGPDLHTMHPISFTYDSMLAMQDRGLEDPTSYRIGDPKRDMTVQVAPVPSSWSGISLAGKTIDDALLVEHKLECTSCHDVHKMEGTSPTSRYLLRLAGSDSSGRSDLLCRTCHIK